MMTPFLAKILRAGIIAIVLALAGTIIFNVWLENKMKKVALGLADYTFPFHEYTEQELNQKYPQIRYADVPTRITPEQTYAKFRQALKENNLQTALDQLSKESENYNDNKEILTKAYNDGDFAEAFNEYPEKIEKSTMYETIASFYFLKNEGGHNLRQYIGFLKNQNGNWLIDVL